MTPRWLYVVGIIGVIVFYVVLKPSETEKAVNERFLSIRICNSISSIQ